MKLRGLRLGVALEQKSSLRRLEYAPARLWLDDLTQIVEILSSSVLVPPGVF
jgi:hypothetical protein